MARAERASRPGLLRSIAGRLGAGRVRVFLSYGCESEEEPVARLARALQVALERSGCRVFDYRRSQVLGTSWPQRVREEIRRSHCLLSLLSEDFLKSPWCLAEAFSCGVAGGTPVPVYLVRPETDLSYPLLIELGPIQGLRLSLSRASGEDWVSASCSQVTRHLEPLVKRARRRRGLRRAAWLAGGLALASLLLFGSQELAGRQVEDVHRQREQVEATTRSMRTVLEGLQSLSPSTAGRDPELDALLQTALQVDRDLVRYREQQEHFQRLQETFSFDFLQALEDLAIHQEGMSFAGTCERLAERAAGLAEAWQTGWERAREILGPASPEPHPDLIPFVRAGAGPESERLEFAYCAGPLLAGVDHRVLAFRDVEYRPGDFLVFVLVPEGARDGAPFYLSKFELTRAQWRELGGRRSRLNEHAADDQPVVFVDFTDVVECLSRTRLRVPTCGEWQAAAARHTEAARRSWETGPRPSAHFWLGAGPDASPKRVGWQGEAGAYDGRAVSYTHLTLPTIYSV